MVNMSNREGKPAFFVACEKGFINIVKAMLLSHAQPHSHCLNVVETKWK